VRGAIAEGEPRDSNKNRLRAVHVAGLLTRFLFPHSIVSILSMHPTDWHAGCTCQGYDLFVVRTGQILTHSCIALSEQHILCIRRVICKRDRVYLGK